MITSPAFTVCAAAKTSARPLKLRAHTANAKPVITATSNQPTPARRAAGAAPAASAPPRDRHRPPAAARQAQRPSHRLTTNLQSARHPLPARAQRLARTPDQPAAASVRAKCLHLPHQHCKRTGRDRRIESSPARSARSDPTRRPVNRRADHIRVSVALLRNGDTRTNTTELLRRRNTRLPRRTRPVTDDHVTVAHIPTHSHRPRHHRRRHQPSRRRCRQRLPHTRIHPQPNRPLDNQLPGRRCV